MTSWKSDALNEAANTSARSDKKWRATKLGCFLSIIFYLFFPLINAAPGSFKSIALGRGFERAGRSSPFIPTPHRFSKELRQNRDAPVRVIVRLRKSAKISVPKGLRPALRKRTIFNLLKQHNLRRQAGLSQYLEGNRPEAFLLGRRTLSKAERAMHGLWIADSIALNATPYEIEKLRECPDVAEVDENSILSVLPVTAGSTGTSSPPATLWNFDSIRLDALQALSTSNGAGVLIGELDTGINSSIPDLQEKVTAWTEFDALGNKIDSLPHETNYLGHGTDVASIMVGNTTGIAPGARLLCALVLPGGFGTLEQVLAGMQWVLDPDGDPNTPNDGADIVNMSFGTPGECMPMWDAVDNMVLAGVLPVAAIGNGGSGNTCSPGNAPGAVGVGAVDSRDQVAMFSGGGQDCCINGYCFIKPDITAPGVNVPGLDGQGNYQTLSGTSMAAPHVSGVAALLKSSYPSITASQLRAFLLNGSDDLSGLGQDAFYGWGKLDALSSWEELQADSSLLNTADLVVESSDSTAHEYLTFFSDGSGSFMAGKQQELDLVGDGSTTIKTLGVADVDGDGFADLIIKKTKQANNGSYLISYVVYPCVNGKGFSSRGATWYSFASISPNPYQLIGLADLTGDKRADLVLAVRQPTANGGYRLNVVVLASTGESFRESGNYWANINCNSYETINAALGDVNGDGKSDLVVARTSAYSYGWCPVYHWVYLSSGSMLQSPALWSVQYLNYQAGSLYFLALADADGDGRADLVLAASGQDFLRPDGISVYVGISTSYNQFRPPQLWAQVPAGGTRIMAVGDVNGDRLADLIAGSYQPGSGAYTFTAYLADKDKQGFIPVQAKPGFSIQPPLSAGDFRLLGVAEAGLGAW